MSSPLIGVFYHWLGGLASASFYIPYRGVKNWSWETYWLVGGFFSWIIAPLTLASLLVPDLWKSIGATPGTTLFWAYFFGAMWGVGGLTLNGTVNLGSGNTVTLSAANTYSGGTTINAGTVLMDNNAAPGSGTVSTIHSGVLSPSSGTRAEKSHRFIFVTKSSNESRPGRSMLIDTSFGAR